MRHIAQLPTSKLLFLRALGAGGNGEVWLARDERGNDVAVKVLNDARVADARALDALERTLQRVAQLNDSRILRVQGLCSVDGRVCLVMEYASGGDLRALRGKPWRAVVPVVLPIAGALARLHRAGIAHRDVKVSNVLRAADGTALLADFESAAPLGARPDGYLAPGSLYTRSPASLDGAPVSVADDVYGFGAMLYELLSGYPPFYPDVTPERIRSEAPGRISATPELPEALQDLIARCLRKAVEERPSSMDVVQAHMERVLNGVDADQIDASSKEAMTTNDPNNERPARRDAPVIRPPSPPAEPLRGEWRRSDPAPHSAARGQGVRRALAFGGIALAVLALFVVFFVLPKWVEAPPPAAAQVQPSAPVESSEKSEPPAPVDYAALARAKQDADEVREPLFERLEALRERAAEQWAADAFKNATEELAAGDAQYEKREYDAAIEHFQALAPMLSELERRANEVLREQLANGADALATGRSEAAQAAFELALKIDPKNAVASRGLQRAGTLDRALALLASAQRAEQDGNLEAALADFSKALELDRDLTQASEGVARVSARKAGDAFAGAMARGFAELGAGQFAAARRAFEEAGRIRPNAPEVADALKQIEQSERTRTIAQRLADAQQAEARERWDDALQSYKDILSLDPTVADAKAGVARVQPRAELNAELELYLTQPERLFSSPVRAAARQTLQRAGQVPNPGPVLTQQLEKLREWLARADVPVRVALQSDNLTHVTIFRVGALGAFEERSLELEPGEYTIVGTRPGYRDVRRQIMVIPGQPMPPVVIRCEDRI
jgi:tetratricopeptide (TPR) repeat protein